MKKERETQVVLTLDQEEFFSLEEMPPVQFLEIRLDLFLKGRETQKRILEKIEKLNARIVLTYRQPEDSSLESRSVWNSDDVTFLLDQLRSGIHYLDLELDKDNSIFQSADETKFGIIRSVHSFKGILNLDECLFYYRNVLEESFASAKTTLPFDCVLKLAVLPASPADAESFSQISLEIAKRVRKSDSNLGYCGIIMGEFGKEFRIFPEKIGSDFTYACLQNAKAPGQVSLNEILKQRSVS
ncbi:3-dehydroquinase [Leptospira perolatii]|uniref:3-dehydroquinate dehydratase n=1 Tax=Leptospira perolatii TaxID=2023191 RepID=A0A2M9ZR72_9LEPT|nr:type I 3-dehydroquinate dehydratase [Leptospira perolatii]PJZ71048.1 3-dehydroquinase [Leptospira perolatii]PJZ74580.1 3-dehydroquinase [Leptospira perolatii]